MKNRNMKKLAAWLAALSLVCGTALAAHAPGTDAAGAAESASGSVREDVLTEEAGLTEESASAEEETAELMDAAGNVQLAPYSVDGVSRGYYVTGCAASVTAAVIPAQYNGQPVVHIGKEAFKAHKNLVSVVIPDTVETIGAYAFYDCYKLSSITLPASAVFQENNNYSCRDTESLSVHFTKGTGTMPDYTGIYNWTPWYSAAVYNHPVSVVIDDGVKNIGAYAFYDCNDLSTVRAGADVAAAGEYAFSNCVSMEDAQFIAQLNSIGKGAFQNCATIPEAIVKPGVKAIPQSAFQGCHSLNTVVLPDSVETIGAYAFYDCYNLSSFTLPVSAVFQENNNYSCRDTESLSVHITKGTGTMPDYTGIYNWTPWYSAAVYNHPVSVVIDDGVETIGAYAFYDCNDLTKVTAGADLAVVGDFGFCNCEIMESAPFISQLDSMGASAFKNCYAIPEAVVKPGVTAVPDSAFQGCHSLKTVVLPDSVQTIGAYAFYDCYNLSSFTLPASAVFQENNNYSCRDAESLSVHITKGTGTMPDYTGIYNWTPWYSAAVYNHPVTLVIDDGVKNIGAYAFYDCNDLTKVTAGGDLAAVGDFGFCNCEIMESAPFISQLDSMGASAFKNCYAIPEAVVKPGVTAVPYSAFQGCHSLNTVVLPDSVETIGAYAFYDCYNLSSFTLPASAVFQENNNYSCRDAESLSVHITKGTGTMPDYTGIYNWTPWYSAAAYNHPVTLVIDDGVKNIGAHAFYDCNDLTKVTAGGDLAAVGDFGFCNCEIMESAPFISQLDSIGTAAFKNCYAIPEAVVKPGVTAVPDSAFQGCHSLKTVVLPDSVQTIGVYAFYDCYKLSSFTLPASAVFQENNNYSCRDAEGLSVHITKGSGTMPGYKGNYNWTPWYSASAYNHPVTVEIDEGVENLGQYSFYDCNDMTTLSLPASLKLVDSYATESCKALKTVYYSGSAQQWASVTIKDHNSLTNAKIVYSQGIRVSVLDSAGRTLSSMAFHDLSDCTIACTLYDARGRMISAEVKSSGEAVFAASDSAVRARILFLSGDGLVPVRAAETLWLQAA